MVAYREGLEVDQVYHNYIFDTTTVTNQPKDFELFLEKNPLHSKDRLRMLNSNFIQHVMEILFLESWLESEQIQKEKLFWKGYSKS